MACTMAIISLCVPMRFRSCFFPPQDRAFPMSVHTVLHNVIVFWTVSSKDSELPCQSPSLVLLINDLPYLSPFSDPMHTNIFVAP